MSPLYHFPAYIMVYFAMVADPMAIIKPEGIRLCHIQVSATRSDSMNPLCNKGV